MDEAPSLTTSDHAAHEASKDHPSHVAVEPVTSISSTASVFDPERPFFRGPAPVGGGTLTRQRGLPIVTSNHIGALLSTGPRTRGFAISSLATSRPDDSLVAATTGWRCCFCLTQREAERVAKAYTIGLLKTQQQTHNEQAHNAHVIQQHTHGWQRQHVQHQQPLHEEKLQQGQQQTIKRRSPQFEQYDGTLRREQQHQQEQGVDKQPPNFKEEDWRNALCAATSNWVQNFTASTSPKVHHGSSGSFGGREKSFSPAISAAFSGEVTDTARAYVRHLTFHREHKRSPSPRRVPAGFVVRKYVQNLKDREERLIQEALAMAGQYTSSLYRAQRGRAQQKDSGASYARGQLCCANDMGHTPADISCNQSCMKSGSFYCEADTGLQRQQRQQRQQMQQQGNKLTEEAVPAVNSAYHSSSQQQVPTGWADSNANHMPTEADQQNRSEVAVVTDDCTPNTVVVEEDVTRARALASHVDHEKGRTEAVVPVVATPAPILEQTAVAEAAKDTVDTASGLIKAESYEENRVTAKHLVPEAPRLEPRGSSAHETPSAVKDTSDSSRFSKNPRGETDLSVLATDMWLDERERLHLE